MTLLTSNKINVLIKCLEHIKHLDGDIAELGIYKGGSAKIIMDLIGSKNNYHLFDTFTGLPIAEADLEVGKFSCTIDKVKELIGNSNNICWHEGIFPNTFVNTDCIKKKYAFVHLDMDLYEPTKQALELFNDLMVKDGIILLDDYKYYETPGIERAVNESKLFSFASCNIGNQLLLRRL
jgi:hypothetical protein